MAIDYNALNCSALLSQSLTGDKLKVQFGGELPSLLQTLSQSKEKGTSKVKQGCSRASLPSWEKAKDAVSTGCGGEEG